MGAARILVVEDDEGIRRVLDVMLRQAGYEVIAAADGEEGLRALREGRFDLVLTDLALPKVSGLQVVRAAKHHASSRVVAMSAHWQYGTLLAEAERLGCDAVLGKPFDRAQLLRLVAEELSKAGSRP